eukprot:6065371-Amphidinium_carterae.1
MARLRTDRSITVLVDKREGLGWGLDQNEGLITRSGHQSNVHSTIPGFDHGRGRWASMVNKHLDASIQDTVCNTMAYMVISWHHTSDSARIK